MDTHTLTTLASDAAHALSSFATENAVALSTVTALAVGATVLVRTLTAHEARKARVKYMRYLLRGFHARIKMAAMDAAKLEQGEIVPVLAEAALAPATMAGKDAEKLVRRLRFVEETVQRQLEALDNIKPNAMLIEFTVRYPLPAEATEIPENDDRLPHDVLFDAILALFTEKERAGLAAHFDEVKAARKAVVTDLLGAMERIDEAVDQVKARVVPEE
ncbi:hypothetical protein H9P43_005493 [Blastocladiella emersonii ATCC 22665]|nr:hypothetical protein H9P43_005493 [Blastocladiella emersonii ATCC 22665]